MESGSLAQGLSALTQPLKLRLQRTSGEGTLRDYSANVVLIEPLATMAAVEDFLYPRIMPRSTPASAKPVATQTAVPKREPEQSAAAPAEGGSAQPAEPVQPPQTAAAVQGGQCPPAGRRQSGRVSS